MPNPSLHVQGYTLLAPVLYEGQSTLVLRARRDADDELVVIKTSSLSSARQSARERARLEHEYRLLEGLHVPGVVRALELVRGERSALVLSTLPGRPLRELLLERRPPLARALSIAIALCDALSGLHRVGIVHRDLSPANVLYDEASDTTHLIDFDIASLLSQEPESAARKARLEGTLGYLSPEQTGITNRPVDCRSDLYSLGTLLYEMLAGAQPFPSDDPLEAVYAVIARTPPPLGERAPDVPEPLGRIVHRLLAKDPEDRYQSAEGLKADLSECQKQLAERGEIVDFPLGRSDTRQKLRISHRIYGRERELGILLAAFERAARGAAELVLVTGYSGVGKSSLVHEAFRAVAARGGYVAEGKCEQLDRDRPFFVIGQALRELVRQALDAPGAQADAWKAQLANKLGKKVALLEGLVPELARIHAPEAELELAEVHAPEAERRFQLALLDLLSVFCAPGRPLLLLLDDLQWIDPASLRLLQLLLRDPDAKHLLVLGAYRDNELGAAHPLASTLASLERDGAPIQRIALGPLSPRHVAELLSDTLDLSMEAVEPLAQVTHGKTRGNPFFLSQFLERLNIEGKLRWQEREKRWTWDLPAIEGYDAPDDVITFLLFRLEALPAETQRALGVAAFLGHRFDITTLARALEEPIRRSAEALWPALREALLVPIDSATRYARFLDEDDDVSLLGPMRLAFSHDRVEQAAYASTPEAERAELHLGLGRMWLARAGESPSDEELFEIVRHMNAGATLAASDERARLMRLDLLAGRRARAKGAFSTAAKLFSAGIAIFEEREWDRDYELAFALHVECAESCGLDGRFDEADRLFESARSHARSLFDEAMIAGQRVRRAIIQGRFDQAIDIALDGLRLLGVTIEESKEAIATEQEELIRALGNREVEELVDAPLVTDREVRAALELLEECGPAAFNARPALLPLLLLRMVNLSLRHGNTETSAYAYGSYGYMLASSFGEPALAGRFSGAALRLNERFGDMKRRGTLLHMHGNHVNFWRTRYRDNLPILDEAFAACLEVGNWVFGGFVTFEAVWQHYEAGRPIREVLSFSERFVRFARKINNEAIFLTLRVVQQFLRCLMGETEGDASLDDEHFNAERCLAELQRYQYGTGIAFYHILRGMLLLSSGRPADALASLREVEPIMGAVLSMPIEATFHCYRAIARARVEAQAANGDALQADIDKLARWAEHCPANFRHQHRLALAERARAMGDELGAMRFYEEAIDNAHAEELPHMEALACELAGGFQLEHGRARAASGYLRAALTAHRRHGARARARALEKSHGELIGPLRAEEGTMVGTLGTTDKDNLLDVAAILRAAGAISSEIVLERALEQVIRVICMISGAQRTALLLDRQGELKLCALMSTDPPLLELGQCRLLDNYPDLPSSLVREAARRDEALALTNPAEDVRFREDPYLRAVRPRSVLCLPLRQKGRRIGVLYLESALSEGAFDPERTELLRMLSAQAAVSVENATFYEEVTRMSEDLAGAKVALEEEVRARTEELHLANASLRHELVERARAEEERRALQEEKLLAQSERLAEMATPLLPIRDDILVMPIIGSVDAPRAQQILETALGGAQRYRARMVILDVTGMRSIDTQVVGLLLSTARALRLLGCTVLLTGIRPEMARSLVALGVDLTGLVTRSTLQSGVSWALSAVRAFDS